MKNSFYAVGWQAAQSKQVYGQVKDFRKIVIKSGVDGYIEQLQFVNNINGQGETLYEKFKGAIQTLDNVETNGNNTEVPFYRVVSEALSNEKERIDKITEKIGEELPALKDLEKIRFYIITEEVEGVVYRYFIKALRTAKLNTRFIMTATAINGTLKIMDTENNGKALPYVICYAEKIDNESITQYIFNVQDYEDIFGLNESKIRVAKANFEKFFPKKDGEIAEYKISESYYVEVEYSEKEKILKKIENNKKIANLLSKYKGEADSYNWEDVKKANKYAKDFMQTPFHYDENTHIITLTAESLDAWVSVISNTKKLGIANHQLEDSLATKRVNQS